MNGEDRNFELIEGYLKGKLQDNELKDFQAALENNTQLQNKLAAHQLANDLIIANRLQEVKSIFQEEHAAHSGKSNWWKGGLAGLIALSIIGLFWLLNSKKEDKSIAVNTPLITEQIFRNEPISDSSKDFVNSASDKKVTNKKIIVKEEIIYPDNAIVITDTASIESQTLITNDTIEQIPLPEPESLPISIPTKAKEIEKVDPCAAIEITVSTTIKSACKNQSDGEIIISSIKGGKEPYQTRIFENKTEQIVSSTGLGAGVYDVIISDSQGCKKNIKKISVPEKICLKDYHFNPYFGEEWHIPTNNVSGKLFVYDNSGKVYYEKQLTGSGIETWNGQSLTGDTNPGFYLFVIKSSDGTEIQGTITITQ